MGAAARSSGAGAAVCSCSKADAPQGALTGHSKVLCEGVRVCTRVCVREQGGALQCVHLHLPGLWLL